MTSNYPSVDGVIETRLALLNVRSASPLAVPMSFVSSRPTIADCATSASSWSASARQTTWIGPSTCTPSGSSVSSNPQPVHSCVFGWMGLRQAGDTHSTLELSQIVLERACLMIWSVSSRGAVHCSAVSQGVPGGLAQHRCGSGQRGGAPARASEPLSCELHAGAHPQCLAHLGRKGPDIARFDVTLDPLCRPRVEHLVEVSNCRTRAGDDFRLATMKEVAGSIGARGHPSEVQSDRARDAFARRATRGQVPEESFVIGAKDVEVELGGDAFFAAEVVIDAPNARSRSRLDVVDRCTGDAVTQEARQRRVQDRVAPGIVGSGSGANFLV